MNGTKAPDDDVCAIICRSQSTCVGFAKDPVSHFCLWFDDVKPKPGVPQDSCSSETETQFVKKWQAPVNNDLWTTMEKIHVFDKAIGDALELADTNANGSNVSFVHWWGFDGNTTDFDGNTSMGLRVDDTAVKLGLKSNFLDHIDNYTGVILNTTAMRKQYLILQTDALSMVADEVLVNPALEPPFVPNNTVTAKKITAIAGFESPLGDPPKALKWQDFPNSEDTPWSRIHPDCPMGEPCVCNCGCRGAPPQNFVEPEAEPTTPCPPPVPMMNPAMLSATLMR